MIYGFSSPFTHMPSAVNNINNYFGTGGGWAGAMPAASCGMSQAAVTPLQLIMQGVMQLLGMMPNFGLPAQCGLGGCCMPCGGMPSYCGSSNPWCGFPCGNVCNPFAQAPQPWHQVSQPVDDQGKKVKGTYTEDGAFYINPNKIGDGVNIVDPNTKIQKKVDGEWVDI